jgi:hypothetical protein
MIEYSQEFWDQWNKLVSDAKKLCNKFDIESYYDPHMVYDPEYNGEIIGRLTLFNGTKKIFRILPKVKRTWFWEDIHYDKTMIEYLKAKIDMYYLMMKEINNG